MGERHGRCAKVSGIRDREIHLVFGGHGRLERDAIRLGDLVPDAMLDEVETLLFSERGLEIRRASQEAGLAFLADAALEDGLYENRSVLRDERLDLFFAGIGRKHLRARKSREVQ